MKKVMLRWKRKGEGREGSWCVVEYDWNLTPQKAQLKLREAVALALWERATKKVIRDKENKHNE